MLLNIDIFNKYCVTLSLWHVQWPYGDICGIAPAGKGQGTEFNLTFRKGSGKKSETLKFSTEHRTELLTEALVRDLIFSIANGFTCCEMRQRFMKGAV